MASSQVMTSNTGSRIVLAGLLAQIIIFAFFVVAAFVFHRRLQARPTTSSQDTSLAWEKFLEILYITSGLILARNIVRVAEFVEGFNGYIILHEVFLYIFDAVPLVAVMYIFNVWHPASLSKQVRMNRVKRHGNDNIEISTTNTQT
jgi:hypothetical protein